MFPRNLFTYRERGGRVELFRVESLTAAVWSVFLPDGSGYTSGIVAGEPITQAAAVACMENEGWQVVRIDGVPYTPPPAPTQAPGGYRDTDGRPVVFIQAGNGVLVPVRFDVWDKDAGTITAVTLLAPMPIEDATADDIAAGLVAGSEVAGTLKKSGIKVR